MPNIADFFALRPVFTLARLRIVWLVVLLYYGLEIFTLVRGTWFSGQLATWDWMSLVFLFVPPLFAILLVRVLMEIAIAVLPRVSGSQGG